MQLEYFPFQLSPGDSIPFHRSLEIVLDVYIATSNSTIQVTVPPSAYPLAFPKALASEAMDTTEGEQKLSYMESRREHLWYLLQIGMGSTSVPKAAVDLSKGAATATASPKKSDKPTSPAKRTRKKPAPQSNDETASTTPSETSIEPAPKKKQTRKKTKQDDSSISETLLETNITPSPTDAQKIDEGLPRKKNGEGSGDSRVDSSINQEVSNPPHFFGDHANETPPQQQTPKKSSGRVDQRKPKRDAVGQQ
ncbi:hypothetical protein [Nostoc sp. FACHB-133]|uniref:hypothetical protein n=1 Tax=Nostoc sp. FACHB-133 TaxID=2692835 RepID=UPI001F54DE95|nr:hypothetical protein [Nostoc sp. FACHB-133]